MSRGRRRMVQVDPSLSHAAPTFVAAPGTARTPRGRDHQVP